LEKILLKQW